MRIGNDQLPRAFFFLIMFLSAYNAATMDQSTAQSKVPPKAARDMRGFATILDAQPAPFAPEAPKELAPPTPEQIAAK
jgi:hypothetical protein